MAVAGIRGVIAGIAVATSACAARASSLPAQHPADPAAAGGRLAGPPAILRAARPPVGTPAETTPAEAAPEPAPEHHHE